MSRDDDAYRESTRDPIFLFQWATLQPTREWGDLEYCGECEQVFEEDRIIHDRRHEADEDDIPVISNQELLSRGAVERVWETSLVFLTREEGEAFGRATHYHYPDGWQVYCVPAEGSLKEVLQTTDVPL